MLAGRRCVAPVAERLGAPLLRAALTRSIPVANGLHRVEDVLRLADALGVPRIAELVCPAGGSDAARPEVPYAVIHAAPMFRYKRWNTAGWRALARELAARGLAVVATGGPSEADRRYLDDIWSGLPAVRRRDGVLTFPDLAALISGAQIYVGPDTSITHLAAAAGCPTVALLGPTDPRIWGPWPIGGLPVPWDMSGTIQRRGNVWIVQNPQPCLPCQLEGCERHISSISRCLDELPIGAVMPAVDAALAMRTEAASAGAGAGSPLSG